MSYLSTSCKPCTAKPLLNNAIGLGKNPNTFEVDRDGPVWRSCYIIRILRHLTDIDRDNPTICGYCGIPQRRAVSMEMCVSWRMCVKHDFGWQPNGNLFCRHNVTAHSMLCLFSAVCKVRGYLKVNTAVVKHGPALYTRQPYFLTWYTMLLFLITVIYSYNL